MDYRMSVANSLSELYTTYVWNESASAFRVSFSTQHVSPEGVNLAGLKLEFKKSR